MKIIGRQAFRTKNRYLRLSVYLLYILALLCFASFISPPYKTFYIEGYAQGTTYHITYYSTDSLVSKQQMDSVLDKLDSSLSIYKSWSVISQFNKSDRGIVADAHLKKVIARSLEIYKDSKGLFDITVEPLVQAWGFGTRHESSMPDSAKIASIMPCVGSNKIALVRDSLIKNKPCITIDVNGIAQGYSVDVLADFLEKNKIHNYLVEVGGELRCKGKKLPGNEPIAIGIEAANDNPFQELTLQKKIVIGDGAITTSGINKKSYKKGRRKISHLIDPTTGYSIDNELVSVSVLAKDAITADGYDNVLMCLGLKKAIAFVNASKGKLAAFFIYHKQDGSLADTATQGFRKFIRK
ncbi:FAD:protein FMN transferase [Parasediminibacterium sp. JCM 36343]|uniref:FAD:protein FMN transferase n=1 Tax=Parasediminibacterium sp. JCM 36343 TaxID=3374279 RepID=UPI00397D8A26